MNYYAFHIGDYASATQHLTEFEDLAYRRLMDVYYVNEKALPLDRRQVYRLVRASSEAMREAVDAVLGEFFTEQEDGWHHRRCDAEIGKVAKRRENCWWSNLSSADRCAMAAARRSAKRRAVPHWLTREQKRQIKNIYAERKSKTLVSGVLHHVDHIIPLVSQTVCGLHVPWNLQVITAEENLSKSNVVLQ